MEAEEKVETKKKGKWWIYAIIVLLIIIIVLLLFCFGILMFSMGILGEYMWRIFDAARNRPPFIVDTNPILPKDDSKTEK